MDRESSLPSLPLSTPTSALQPPGLPSLIARAPSPNGADDGETSCTGSGCEKPTSNLTTTVFPVVLGAGVPILCAIVVLIFLHRRHVKKLMREDANDKHRSLDFGLDVVGPSGKKDQMGHGDNGMPQMMEPSHTKGMSLDVHPYLMPPGIHGSTDSLHSLSRSIDDDKYRPATFITHENSSVRSLPRTRDDASSVAGSTTRFGAAEEPNAGLLRNAQRMSRSSPPLHRNSPDEHRPQPAQPPHDYLGPLPGLKAPSEQDERGLAIGSATTDHNKTPEPQVDTNLASGFHFETEPSPPAADHSSASHEDHLNFPLPGRASSHQEGEHAQSSTMQLPRISLPASDATSDYGDDRKSELMIPAVNVHGVDDHDQRETGHQDNKLPDLPEEPQTNDIAYDPRRDTRRLTLGRANRIRSFYKEYFDDSKRETTYYEDYGPEFYEGGYAYDPVTGDYYDAAPPPLPFAEPMGRRAMTPPPRAPPRFQGGARHMATSSGGWNGFAPGPRAFSSASGRLPGPRAPRKPMPPPAPLQVLPTPHMLKDDAFMTAADFAPANNFRDQRAGRAETPTGGMRPYSPAIRAHTPLASPFDELAAIPNASALRKSGTYTALDFAPPPRFKNDTASDAGSIRSNRTGISNTHMNNIRMGNYRVSRLPTDMVGTKDDLMSSLRPNWDMKR
ncbi:hypothetical protein N7512_004991 [Penicillium capsulatum]|nr:hypothetical protein N7512_004991 [Penicillium capsulatum]